MSFFPGTSPVTMESIMAPTAPEAEVAREALQTQLWILGNLKTEWWTLGTFWAPHIF